MKKINMKKKISEIGIYLLSKVFIFVVRMYFIFKKFNIFKHTLTNDEFDHIELMCKSKDEGDQQLAYDIIISSNLKFKHIYYITKDKPYWEDHEYILDDKTLHPLFKIIINRLEKKVDAYDKRLEIKRINKILKRQVMIVNPLEDE